LEKVVVLDTLSSKIRFTIFGFSMIFNRFYKVLDPNTKQRRIFLRCRPWNFSNPHKNALGSPLGPTAEASSPAARWGMGR
jgi:hypothetical protein